MKKAIAYFIVALALATATTLQAHANDVTANIVNVTAVWPTSRTCTAPFTRRPTSWSTNHRTRELSNWFAGCRLPTSGSSTFSS